MVLRRARLELDAVPRAATSEGLGDGQIWACAHMGWDGWLGATTSAPGRRAPRTWRSPAMLR